jgi:hypothetical protein
MTTPATPSTAEEVREEQEAEYGRYRANSPIYIDGVRAFNEGDPVPVSHVTRKVVNKDQVDDLGKKG